MGQRWRYWVDCSDSFGCARQVLVTVSEAAQLEVRLPGGEAVWLHRFQAQQLRVAVEQGMGVLSRAGGRVMTDSEVPDHTLAAAPR